MGLVRGMARTAVVAGTATAVSNRVSRRQAGRWAEQSPPPQESYPPPPPTYAAPPPPVYAAPAPDAPDVLEQLKTLGELRAAGVLTEEEFAAQKAKILAS
jgi:hypothetical protein